MKKYSFLFLMMVCAGLSQAQTLVSKNVNASFFSSAPIEDIEAISKVGASAIDTKTGSVLVKIPNTSFQFKKKLMQEHFNENYIESDKYPTSEFRGKIVGHVDYAKPGTYNCTAKGNLQIHGVSKAYEVPLKIVVSDTAINTNTVFNVKLVDHGVDIPKIVIKNIAEVVQVKISASHPLKK